MLLIILGIICFIIVLFVIYPCLVVSSQSSRIEEMNEEIKCRTEQM